VEIYTAKIHIFFSLLAFSSFRL